MNDSRRALLGELSIDRNRPSPDGGAAGGRRSGGLPLLAVALLALVAAGVGAAAAWWLLREAPAIDVDVVPVRRVGADGAAVAGDGRGAGAAAGSSRQRAADESVLDATGYVTARRQATVSSEVTGRVVEVLVEEGMEVAEGQLLARLDDRLPAAAVDLAVAQLEAARASLEETEAQLREAERNYVRVSDLQARNLASDRELDAAIAAVDTLRARLDRQQRDIVVAERALAVQQRQLENLRIVAPFAGVVIDKAAQPGEMISPVSAGGGFTRTGICTIVDMDSLEVEVDVNESYINRVSPGQPVAATLNSYPDWQIPAEVITIIPSADRNRATVRVRIRLLERDARILPDMGVKVAFLPGRPGALARGAEPTAAPPSGASAAGGVGGAGSDSGALAPGLYVPADAVWRRGTSAIAFVAGDSGRAQMRTISVGETVRGERRVLAGLDEGELVVTGVTDALASAMERGARLIVQRGN